MLLNLGLHSYICEPKHIHGSMGNINIGKYCSIAANVTFDAGYQHYYKAATTFPMHILKQGVESNVWCGGDINIGNDVWIGMGVTVMGGVTIGDGAVVGANVTVRRSIRPYEIYTGSKKPEKFRFSHDIIYGLLTLRWWNWPEDRILRNAELLIDKDINKFLEGYV